MKNEPTFATKRDLFKLMNAELEDLEEREPEEGSFKNAEAAAGTVLDAARIVRNKTNEVECEAVEYYVRQISGSDPELLHALLTEAYRQAADLAAVSVRLMAITRRAIVRLYGDIDRPGTGQGQEWTH